MMENIAALEISMEITSFKCLAEISQYIKTVL